MTERLNLCSSLGRRTLYELEWLHTREEVERELERVAEVLEIWERAGGSGVMERLETHLMQVRDIRGTVMRTGGSGGLDDLELFELKSFALLAEEMRGLTEGWKGVRIPVLREVVELLDPDGTQIPQFYVYDAYSAELAALRAEMRLRKQQGAEEAELVRLYERSVELEDGVREDLSRRLRGSYPALKEALEQVALLDIVVAKARQAKELGLVRPSFADEVTVFVGLEHPQVAERLKQEGRYYQRVDVALVRGATLITGANMAGKTVLLKSVALAQCLLQFGFYVPARRAEMVPVDEVVVCIGDEQDELSGLSSFAAEMLRIHEVVEKIRQGEKVLVLIDELARTTNPTEGRAIVNGVVGFLTEHGVTALVTTHYSGITAPCRRLRVKGFVEGKGQGQLTRENISEFIDYSLEEYKGGEVPREALRIAALLGVDEELLQKIESTVNTDIYGK